MPSPDPDMADADAPRLRPDIEAFPVVYQGREGVASRDALGLIARPVVVQGEALVLLRLLDRIVSSAPDYGSSPDTRVTLAGLAAPHLDLAAGAPGYAAAYGLLDAAAADLVILFGTGHSLEGGYLALTEKDFRTPLGRVRTDREIVRALRRAAGPAAAADDLAHRREHSLEFQLLFLQRRLGRDFALVPILWVSFAKDLRRVSRPSELPGVAEVIGCLREVISRRDRRTLVIAGVDLSHIGPKFGHARSALALRAAAEAHDRRLLEAAGRGDVEAFWAESQRVGDAYNVCGFASLACVLEVLAPVSGRLLAYDMTMEEASRSGVSFAALDFYRQGL